MDHAWRQLRQAAASDRLPRPRPERAARAHRRLESRQKPRSGSGNEVHVHWPVGGHHESGQVIDLGCTPGPTAHRATGKTLAVAP